MTNAVKKFGCENCSFSAETLEAYQTHWKGHHIAAPDPDEFFECGNCGTEFEDKETANACCSDDEEGSDEEEGGEEDE